MVSTGANELNQLLEVGLCQCLRVVGIHDGVHRGALIEGILSCVGEFLCEVTPDGVSLLVGGQLGLAHAFGAFNLQRASVLLVEQTQAGVCDGIGILGCVQIVLIAADGIGEVLLLLESIRERLVDVSLVLVFHLEGEALLVLLDGLVHLTGTNEGIAIVQVVKVREVDAVLVNLGEEVLTKLHCFVELLQLVAAEHGQTVQRTVVGLLGQTSLGSVVALLVLLSHEAGVGILNEVRAGHLAGGNLSIGLDGLTILQRQVVDVSLQCVDGIVGTLGLQLIELGGSAIRINLAVDQCILTIGVGIRLVVVDSLLVHGCCLSTIVA